MTPFNKGFYEELTKIAINFDPELTQQLMAGAEVPALPSPSIINLQNAKLVGGALMGMAQQQMTEAPQGHRYVSYNPPSTLRGFRY